MSAVTVSPSRHTSTASPQPQNPIALRLYKALGANFDDAATREALQTLSELYAPSPFAYPPAKSRDVSRDGDDAQLDGLEDGDAPNGLSRPATNGVRIAEPIPGDIAARARRNLRRDVESRLAESSRKFLKAFGEVDKQLDTLQEHLSAMRVRCDEAQTQLDETNDACKSLLDRAGSLREERQVITTRQSIVSLLLGRFTLDEEEKEALTSRDVPVDKRFFRAMDKAEKIRDDCRVLMTGEDGPTPAGVDILSATSSYLEQAYQKIFRWCCFQFRQMGRDAQLEVGPSMREAVRRLRERPELLTEALTYLSHTRQDTLLTAFTNALTRGGPGGLPRPIEMHAHDPLRYVGDMLAWVHQAIAAEREFLESLFDVRGDKRMVGSIRRFAASVEEEWMSELMDAAVGKLCTPLKVRVQQTVRSQESSITSYKIANLLQFYMQTMQRTIGEEAILSKALKEMTDMAFEVFFDSVDSQGRSLLRVPPDLDDTSLTPHLIILDHAQVLREIMVVYDSSLLGDETEEQLAAGFRDILDKMVDPAIETCLTSSEEKRKHRPTWDKSVFVLNTLAYLQGVIEPFRFTAEKQGVIQGLIETKVLQLTEEHYRNLLKEAGLHDVVAAIEGRQPSEPPVAHPSGSDLTAADSAARVLSLAVRTGCRRVAAVVATDTADSGVTGASSGIAALGGGVSAHLRGGARPENRYEAAATLLGSERPFGQVHLLWQIFGLQD
ncbi:hypothetical protein EVJ58_g7236 [Rhodofomes roseus]|uniref:Conserved oligomeric Golgi complex subunit 6 n=1 Tax=Rhodofomes roseus TaxID=34475 RepID=A0A4Y9Y6M2_9APHY|nr:hypothetical protein EVJ58_g7236 [Rhodofomes roseus]